MSSSSDGWNLKPGGNNCKAEVGNVDTFSIENRVSWMMREETEATIISIENSWYWKKGSGVEALYVEFSCRCGHYVRYIVYKMVSRKCLNS